MIRILSVEQIRNADKYSIQNEPIASIDLMERAAGAFAAWFMTRFSPVHAVHIFCGTGNNGGDGLAVGRMLLEKTYKVHIYVVGDPAKGSADFKMNMERLDQKNIQVLRRHTDLRQLGAGDVIIDALFGSGLGRQVEGWYAEVINHINEQPSTKVAIDIPSGLFADKVSKGSIVRADHTVGFQQPKLAFVLPQNFDFVGEWHVVDIGLSREFIEQQDTYCFVLSESQIREIIRKRGKYDHKGVFGRALVVAGGYGKMGAAVLSARAALRSGTGLLTTYIPACGYDIMQTAVPEAMVVIDPKENTLSKAPEVDGYDAVGIGPGIGKSLEAVNSMRELLPSLGRPVVVDADALNILSDNRELLGLLPENSILTPHPAEFERLVGKWNNDFERLEVQRKFSKDYQVIVVLKGAHTSISTPEGKVYFNSTGNPGMATAGSGDVLTGMVTAMLAQRYGPEEAAIIAVYTHGLAGDIAGKKHGQVAMIASDILESLGDAFKLLHEG